MMNNDNKNNLINDQEVLDNVSLTLEEQTKEAEKEEQTLAELDSMRTKLCYKRVIQRLRDEEGFEVDEEAEAKIV